MKIERISIRKIFDSRGEPTLECGLVTERGSFYASVPSGKSKGKREAVSVDFPHAKKSIEELKKILIGKEFSSVREFDGTLIAADGTANKSHLGGNVMLGFSMAFARARAAERDVSLWLLLRREFFPNADDRRRPSIFANLINGGAHAENGLDIQEYMLVVRPGKSYADDVALAVDVYRSLGEILKKKLKTKNLPLGDESGYAPARQSLGAGGVLPLDNFEPIKLLEKEIESRKLGKKCSIALDAAASSFFTGKGYKFGGEMLGTKELLKRYEDYFKKSKCLCSIEDPFAEDDEEGFKLLTASAGEKWVVGDDLTTTDAKRISLMALKRAINAVIIKPNQIGTVSEACDALAEAKNLKLKTIVSHRSGETEDAFIISLARASSTDGVKIGAPAHERMLKFNELIRVYEE